MLRAASTRWYLASIAIMVGAGLSSLAIGGIARHDAPRRATVGGVGAVAAFARSAYHGADAVGAAQLAGATVLLAGWLAVGATAMLAAGAAGLAAAVSHVASAGHAVQD
jgi:hypothetical protein